LLKQKNIIIKELPENNLKNNESIINKFLEKSGWISCGYMVLKRKVLVNSPFKKSEIFPSSLNILVPDFSGISLASYKNIVFFDLETTGLSTGSGTVAFLAAFGRIILDKIEITQYLLLDYPGQNDMLENIINEMNSKELIFISYNGKSYDSKIIQTMCIMNRKKIPLYKHVDLLHPSRRLWKNIIYKCSQSSIEKNILNINRKDDIPGSMAPDIWFNFLKTGNTDDLLNICNHNIYDISGLVSILTAIIKIAKNPIKNKYTIDYERIALYWREYLKRDNNHLNDKNILLIKEKLMKKAADNNSPRAVYLYSYDKMINGNYDIALKYTEIGLKLFNKDSIWYKRLIRRKKRIEKILNIG